MKDNRVNGWSYGLTLWDGTQTVHEVDSDYDEGDEDDDDGDYAWHNS